jgi:hypothetical protein
MFLYNFPLIAVIMSISLLLQILCKVLLHWRFMWGFFDAVNLLFLSTCLHCKHSALKHVTEVPY